jgi:4-hydroxythreonine-4-phosphate dehydrogenase
LIAITLGDPFSVMTEMLYNQGDFLEDLVIHGARLHKAKKPDGPHSGLGVVLIGSLGHWSDQWQKLLASGLPSSARFNERVARSMPIVRVGAGEDPFKHLSHEGSQRSVAPLVFWDCDSPGASFDPASLLSITARGKVAESTLHALRHKSITSWSMPDEKLAVVTGPVDKYALDQVGFGFPGQTEFFESLWQAPAVMTLAGPKLRVGLVTNHHAIRHVPSMITADLIVKRLLLFAQTLKELFRIPSPTIGVCGLNPHASDQGKFGHEEGSIIAPAIAKAQALLPHVKIIGPLPADTVFYRAFQGHYDGVLAMYHDQGLGPLKTVHFDEAVNVSGGLPHLRVSPDHGPASDLFLKGQASSKSLRAALELARNYVETGFQR